MVGSCCILSCLFWPFATTFAALWLFITICRKFVFTKKDGQHSDGKVTIGFFHPFCNAGGGGERVLWSMVAALGELVNRRSEASPRDEDYHFVAKGEDSVEPSPTPKHTYEEGSEQSKDDRAGEIRKRVGRGKSSGDREAAESLSVEKSSEDERKHAQRLHIVIYTGDEDATPEQILHKAQDRFGLQLNSDTTSIEFVYLRRRYLIQDKTYPRLTLLGQSLGSMALAWEALCKRTPDIFVDSTGCAFTSMVAKLLANCMVVAYVHYPTISTDMLQRVKSRRQVYENQDSVASSSALSWAKLLYYHAFAGLYGLMGSFFDLVMVNSTWTAAHIRSLWRTQRDKVSIVYPPCDISSLQTFPVTGRKPIIISIGQFRPEKDHPLQLRGFSLFLQNFKKTHPKQTIPRLIMVGGVRDSGDEARVSDLRALCAKLQLESFVEFAVNLPYGDLQSLLSRSSVGLHSMWNEHFGICVVEMMAAGCIVIAHDSGGPKEDIVRPLGSRKSEDVRRDEQQEAEEDTKCETRTGFLAATPEEYAGALERIFALSAQQQTQIRENARESSRRFSEDKFRASVKALLGPLLEDCRARALQ